ncbi:MAG: pirin family protein [Pseudomonadota bacterium]|nr:pirin family protein [Pseudomonadota bacterium]MDO7711285.1 pirin family protein [Pseudomonadota bacterium]
MPPLKLNDIQQAEFSVGSAERVRQVERIVNGIESTDGDGVQLTRVIGSHELSMLDPFLLFDAFESNEAQDYIGGFPSHPHRGFETVTYLLAGRMRHKDSEGREGVIEPGGVQWMTAGRGIIHSEMPEQENGLLHGFQLWVNLPAKDKMTAPAYQEFAADKVTLEQHDNSTEIRVIAGKTNNGATGPVENNYVNPLYMEVFLPAGQVFEQTVDDNDNAFIYVIEGGLAVSNQPEIIKKHQLAVMSKGNIVHLQANENTRFMFASAQPLNEPVARGGPFVMNTKEEIEQAFIDFRRV